MIHREGRQPNERTHVTPIQLDYTRLTSANYEDVNGSTGPTERREQRPNINIAIQVITTPRVCINHSNTKNVKLDTMMGQSHTLPCYHSRAVLDWL